MTTSRNFENKNDYSCIPLVNESYGWKQIPAGKRILFFRGFVHGHSSSSIAAKASEVTYEEIAPWLNSINGHFSIIILGNKWCMAAVDPVRSYPLIWTFDNKRILVSNNGPDLTRAIGLEHLDIDEHQLDAFALSGFTIGPRTLYKKIHQLEPGTFITIRENADYQVSAYHKWNPMRPSQAKLQDLIEPLSLINEKLIDKLALSGMGRKIIVPLSAGLDSRFIASGLKQAGYKNVWCISYGRRGNREIEVAREIANKLGYKWDFIEYTNASVRKALATEDHKSYEEYANCLTSIPFPQDYTALAELRASGRLDPDSIIVNGQSGDFTSGNHIPKSLIEPPPISDKKRLEAVINALVKKHFKHWPSLLSASRLKIIQDMLKSEIERVGGLPSDPNRDHGLYELIEFRDRQAKYVIHGQRLYEYMGLSWRLPLWERESLDFWEKAPLEAKANQNLYKQVLIRDNWGGVWKDIPINPSNIRPIWLYIVRLMAKLIHAPIGVNKWHNFERRYLNYWMSPLCSYAEWPYSKVVREGSNAHGAIALHIKKYLDSSAGNNSIWLSK